MQSALFSEWLLVNITWLVYVLMAMVGGTTGHILAWEHTEPHWTLGMHIARWIATIIKAFFVVFIVYWLCQAYWNVPPPLCYVIAGFGSMFSSDFLRAGYDQVIRKRLGFTTLPKDST